MRVPVVIVNFKTYKEATGEKAVELAKICEKVANETGKKIILCAQAVDIKSISEAVSLEVWAQHVDEVEPGAKTGHITIEAVRSAGAKGTILNHSENRILMTKIKDVVARCKQLNFPVLVCAQNAEEVGTIAELKPNFVAYEPPELIGGDISVSTAKPEVIEDSLQQAGSVPLIVGAGVKNATDVKVSVEMGAQGILVASGVVKAEDIEAAVKDLVSEL